MQEGGKRPVVPLTITVMRCRDEVHLFAINKNAWPAAPVSCVPATTSLATHMKQSKSFLEILLGV